MVAISHYVIPVILALVGLGMLVSDKPLLDAFLRGANEGLRSGIALLPTLVLLLTAVSAFNAGGIADWLAGALSPLCERLGIPSEILPLLIVRPVSGSASTALTSSLFEKYGADSLPGRCISVIMGSSDTMLYVIAVYFGAVGIKQGRHTFISSFLVMIFCIFFSCFAARAFF